MLKPIFNRIPQPLGGIDESDVPDVLTRHRLRWPLASQDIQINEPDEPDEPEDDLDSPDSLHLQQAHHDGNNNNYPASFTAQVRSPEFPISNDHKDLIKKTFADAKKSITRLWPHKDPMINNLVKLEDSMLRSRSLVEANIILKKALSQTGTWLIPRPFDNLGNFGRHMVHQDRDSNKRSAYDHLRELHGYFDEIIYYKTGFIRKKRVFKGTPFGTTPEDRIKGRGLLFKDYETTSMTTAFEYIGLALQTLSPLGYLAGPPGQQSQFNTRPEAPVTPYNEISQKKENVYVNRHDVYTEIVKNQTLERGIINFCYRSKRRGGGGDLKLNVIGLVDLVSSGAIGPFLKCLMTASLGGSYVRLQGLSDAIYTEITEKNKNSQTILYGQMRGYSVEHSASIALEVSFTPLKLLKGVDALEKNKGFNSVVASLKCSIGVGASWNVNRTLTLFHIKNPQYCEDYNKLAHSIADYIPFTTHEKATRYSRVALDQIVTDLPKDSHSDYAKLVGNLNNHHAGHQAAGAPGFTNFNLDQIKDTCDKVIEIDTDNHKAKELSSMIESFRKSHTGFDNTLKRVNKADANIFAPAPNNILFIQHTVHKLNVSGDFKLGIDAKGAVKGNEAKNINETSKSQDKSASKGI
jgi:hypothetical protein